MSPTTGLLSMWNFRHSSSRRMICSGFKAWQYIDSIIVEKKDNVDQI